MKRTGGVEEPDARDLAHLSPSHSRVSEEPLALLLKSIRLMHDGASFRRANEHAQGKKGRRSNV